MRALLLDTPLMPRSPIARAREEEPGARPADACPADAIEVLDHCPMCGGRGRTIVNEFNKLIVLDWLPDEDAARYDHAVCHDCGVLYATRRPAGPRYQWLFEHFELAIGRGAKDDIGNVLASTAAVSDADRQELRRRIARGVFVSEHTRTSRKDYVPALLSDRLQVSAHAEIIGSLLDLRGARVLEVRSRVGSLGAILARLYGSAVSTMAFFERQRVVIEEAYGLPARSRIDFDRFSIPYEGRFDLITANHMITHAVRPREFLAALRAALQPGGHVYFYNEPDDAEYLAVDGQSMIRRLNPFHLQAFDGPSLSRALAANGFETIFLHRHEGEFVCLCRLAQSAGERPQMTAQERQRRIEEHRQARDVAVLMLPPRVRARFAAELPAIEDRVFKAGLAEIGEDGQVRARKRQRKQGSASGS